MAYRILDHTADIGLEATGDDLAEAFVEAARGMFSLIVDPESVDVVKHLRVAVRATDVEDLLMSWLNELIYVHEAESMVLGEFRIEGWDERTELEASVGGEPYDPERHELELGIKASTFNGLVVEPGLPARVVVYFDV